VGRLDGVKVNGKPLRPSKPSEEAPNHSGELKPPSRDSRAPKGGSSQAGSSQDQGEIETVVNYSSKTTKILKYRIMVVKLLAVLNTAPMASQA
jgi:hypothetical protein